MKNKILTEEFDYQAYFDEKYYQPNQLTSRETPTLTKNSTLENRSSADKIFSSIKWIFLYLPGAMTIHFSILGFALSVSLGFLTNELIPEMLLGSLGAFAVAAFMIMLGIGKLLDLRYLKVVAAIASASLSMGILYLILTAITGGNSFGFFLTATLPIIVVAGFLMKLDVDRGNEFDKV